MPNGAIIREVSVQGLHGQLDFELSFDAGLNIIYGKNGTGKTTVLHIIANATELDFSRFSNLQFERIEIKTSEGSIELGKESARSLPKVWVDGRATSFAEGSEEFSAVESAQLRKVLGGRATYLPAFRSVLERVKVESRSYYRSPEREKEIEEAVNRELQALRETAQKEPNPIEVRQLREEAGATGEKTWLCRQWFGRFVPAIRYPSVAEVDEGLTEEWRSSAFEISRKEQRLLEDILVKIFRTVARLEKPTTVENTDQLLASIQDLLKKQEPELPAFDSSDIYNQLLEAVRGIERPSPSNFDVSLLEIYRQVFEKRDAERRAAFEKTREFAQSVNRFLDQKSIQIGHKAFSAFARTRSAVAVRGDDEHIYGLSALSSGERQIVTMLYSASRTKQYSGIFLIDEPELSLHIDWQRIILSELQQQAPGQQIIACTHSPEVGAEHLERTQEFLPRRVSSRQTALFEDEDI